MIRGMTPEERQRSLERSSVNKAVPMQNNLKDGVIPTENIDYLNYALLETLKNLQNVIKNLEERVYALEQRVGRLPDASERPIR